MSTGVGTIKRNISSSNLVIILKILILLVAKVCVPYHVIEIILHEDVAFGVSKPVLKSQYHHYLRTLLTLLFPTVERALFFVYGFPSSLHFSTIPLAISSVLVVSV